MIDLLGCLLKFTSSAGRWRFCCISMSFDKGKCGGSDRYGAVPAAAQQLVKMMELKQLAKKIGFARIKLEGKQNIILETKMEEPAWKTLHQRLTSHLQSRFVFQTGKAIVRGLGSLSADKQLETLIDYLEKMQGDN